MVGAVNTNATQTWEAQYNSSMKAKYDLKPGETWQPEDPDFGKPTSTPTPSTTPVEGVGKKSGLGAGAIAGIAIGAAAVVVIAAVLLYLCGRRGGFDKAYRKSAIQPQTPAPDAAAAPPTMVQTQYHNPHASPVPTAAGLKSPAQASFATFSTHPHMDPNDPYRSMTASPQHPQYPYGTPPPPRQNPISPGPGYGFNTYNGHAVSTPGSPPMMVGELSS